MSKVTLTGHRVTLRSSHTDSFGESVWYAHTETGQCFTIYSNSKTNQIQVRFFPCKRKSQQTLISSDVVAEGVRLLCEHMSTNCEGIPFLSVTKNSSSLLHQICRKAGLKPKKGGSSKNLYYFG